jgi:hypothetical protein
MKIEFLDSGTPKKKIKLSKRDDSVEKKKKFKKDIPSQDIEMDAIIDSVIRNSQSALLSPQKHSSHSQQGQKLQQSLSPIVKPEPISVSTPKSLNSQTFDDDEAAKTLVLMAGEKSLTKRKKTKPSSTATISSSGTPLSDNSSAFQSAMSSFPKVSPGVSPLSPTMFSMTNQNPFFNPAVPTPPLFGHMSPPMQSSMQTSPHDSYPVPPPLTKPKTLAEKKALPPEIMNQPIVKREKDKENVRKERSKDRDKFQKQKHKISSKSYKSKRTISEDESSSDDNIKPKINIKLGSTANIKPVLSTSDSKPSIKSLSSPKHVSNQEELALKKKRGPKKKFMKEEVKEDKSCTVIRETITVDANEGNEKVWICPACKGPDDGSSMIGKSCQQFELKITRSGGRY